MSRKTGSLRLNKNPHDGYNGRLAIKRSDLTDIASGIAAIPLGHANREQVLTKANRRRVFLDDVAIKHYLQAAMVLELKVKSRNPVSSDIERLLTAMSWYF